MMDLPKLTPKVWEYEELKENCLSTLAVVKDDANVRHGSVYVTGEVKVEIVLNISQLRWLSVLMRLLYI